MTRQKEQSINREWNSPEWSNSPRVEEKPFLTPTRLGILAFLAVGTGIALLYLWSSWQAVHWLNERHQAEIELQQLENERERLRFEVGQAFSLKRVETIARRDLGMGMPSTSSGTLNFLRLISE